MPVVISIVGRSGSGKTTLLERLIPEIVGRGYRVGTIKHTIHGFEIDHKGKDSWRLRSSGASTVVISSPSKLAIVKDTDKELNIDAICSDYLNELDIIFTEGYKKESKPKIELLSREDDHNNLLYKDDKNLIAVVSHKNISFSVPCFKPSEIKHLADFIEMKFLFMKGKIV